MQLLISDANILIDLEEGRLLSTFFTLPYQFTIPDILFYEELEDQHEYLLALGLCLGELNEITMSYVVDLVQRVRGPSRNDCFALALAKQEKCPLLTGDRALRDAAIQEGVEVRGTLWIVEEMVIGKIISKQQAHEAYTAMEQKGRRLPWHIAYERLKAL